MNHARPSKRLALKRIAAATAAAVGAALLTYPGAAAAQATGIDCTALGDNPMEDTLSSALDAAVECGVEVRLAPRAWPYSTVSVTPQGRLHLLATADAVQEYRDQGFTDPTLSEIMEATLAQTSSPWRVWLPRDPLQPIFWGGKAGLQFPGDNPVPTNAGNIAEYDEIAPGLDFRVAAGTATSSLRFTAADETAWESLSTGLTVLRDGTSLEIVDGALRFEDGDDRLNASEWTTPFISRDAAGVMTPVALSSAGGGALTLSLPDGALETAAFPLEVSTQWAYRQVGISEWGSVTSAEPGLAAYRGEAGLDVPYFEAAGEAGDALVGDYCDHLASPDCADGAESEAFWKFQWPELEAAAIRPSPDFTFAYPVTSAVFQVDAAEGTPCVAPELHLTGEYTPAATWERRPTAIAPSATGDCTEGTAVYDVTATMRQAWDESTHDAAAVTFGMIESDTTARFTGGSARLDVYMDLLGYTYTAPSPDLCEYWSYGTVPAFSDATPPYGGFLFDTWRPETLDHGITWTASIYEATLKEDFLPGDLVMRTERRPVDLGSRPVYSVSDPLRDDHYDIAYEFTSSNGAFKIQRMWCSLIVDTTAPEFQDVAVEGGLLEVGDLATVSFTIADDSMFGPSAELVLECAGGAVCGDSGPVSVRSTEVTYDLRLTRRTEQVTFTLTDAAGNTVSTEVISIRANAPRSDFNGDGMNDLAAVYTSEDMLTLNLGDGEGDFTFTYGWSPGWGSLDLALGGDLTGDGKADLLARNARTGTLYTYPGDGKGGFGSRITVGPGWNTMGAFTSAGDFNGDRKMDLYAVGRADGKLYFYPGLGNGKFGARSLVGSGWGPVDALVAVGDLDDDGSADLLAHDSRTGQYYLYKGDGTGSLGGRVTIAASLDGSGSDRYSQIMAVGNLDGDGKDDLVALNARTGALELHSLNGNGSPVHQGRAIENTWDLTWGGYRLAAVNEERAYDYNGNGSSDLIARAAAGTTYFYPGNGSGGFGARVSWGTALKDMTLIATAGDMNSDGFSDVLARTSGGALYLYPGTGSGGLNTAGRITIGTGWNAMSSIVGGHDYNSDGKADVLAADSSNGYLWFYPGKGDGTVGPKVRIGTGWNSMREITAAGDLDHDGRPDILAIRSSDNCMYFYGGRGNGTLKTGVKTSCNWNGYDMVAAVGDFNSDGHADWIARRKSDGALFLYRGNGAGGYSARSQIGTGWNSMNIIA
jgi:hypothetical protein